MKARIVLYLGGKTLTGSATAFELVPVFEKRSFVARYFYEEDPVTSDLPALRD
jgi:hypothetical protein